MEFRVFLSKLKESGNLVQIDQECSINLEIARKIKEHDGKPVFFPRVKESNIPVVSGLFGFRGAFYLATSGTADEGFSKDDLFRKETEPATNPSSFIYRLYKAINGRETPLISDSPAMCQEVVEKPDFLQELPILKHLDGDGGRYITSGVVIYKCPKYGRNVSFHRMMIIDDDKLVARVVENRGLDTALRETGGPVEAAIVIGSSPEIMVSASTSAPKGVDELSIANALNPFKVTKCKTIDVHVPSQSEIVIEGKFLPDDLVEEGPFMDLTGTLDIVRKQPTFEVSAVTHRKNPYYHALLPAGKEHEFLMGLPREATMLMELLPYDYVRDVRLTPGSSHWFNSVVQVDHAKPIAPKDVITSCFKGHSSLKNCLIVDDDVNIGDPHDLEFAITTRAQFSKDLYLFPGERGSSLDPSANQVTRETCKVGIDATMSRGKEQSKYLKQEY